MRRLLVLAAVAVTAGSSAAADEKYVTIKGQVLWNGAKPPVLAAVNVVGNKDAPVCCKAGPLMPTNMIVDAKTLGVKNVVVWVRPDTEGRADPFPPEKIHPDLAKPKSKEHVIDQPNCQFEPRVLAARAGDTLVVKNSAGIPHNINYSSDPENVNVVILAGGEHKLKKPLEASRLAISFKCDLHTWMTGRVRVFDHPYYATTDKDGKFEIKDVPAGKWRIVYWHEEGYHLGIPGDLGIPFEAKAEKATLELDPIKLELPPPPKEK